MVVSNRSLSRGLKILRVFNEQPSPSLTEIANHVDLTKATCLRFLRTLQEEGYLSFNHQTKRYQLRPLILELGHAALSSLSVPVMAEPEMEALAEQARGSVHLAMLDGDEVVIVGRAVASRETRRLVTMNIHVGTRLPAHATAMGRMLIATQVPDVNQFVANMRVSKLTPRTLVDASLLAREIQEAADCGWAVVEEQLGIGYSAVAVALKASGDQVLGLAVSVSSNDYTRVRMERELLPRLQNVANGLERAFGHAPSHRPSVIPS